MSKKIKTNLNKFLALSLSFVLIFILAACNNNDDGETTGTTNVVSEPYSGSEFLMGTYVTISIYDEGKEDVLNLAFDRIRELDIMLSSNDQGSDIDAINNSAGKEPVEVTDETFELLELALEYSSVENGSFDLTIGPIINLWRIGFDDARVPEPGEIEEALTLVNHENLILDADAQTAYLTEEGMRIDLGAIAKGYIADETAEVLSENGVSTAILNLGGNIVIMGDSPNRDTGGFNVGVQDPNAQLNQYVGTILLRDKSIVTSGIYERVIEEDGQEYHHLMDPETGYPINNELSSVTIISDKSVDGDGLSTLIFAFGLEEGLDYINNLDGVGAIFITRDFELYTSDDIKDDFRLTNEDLTWINQD